MQDAVIAERIERWTAISSLALVGVTWRLWTPQEVFPQVPVLNWFCYAPPWIDWMLLGGLTLGLISLTGVTRYYNANQLPSVLQFCSRSLVLVSLIGMFLLDQHRFQPWAYMLWLTIVICLSCEPINRLRFLRWLIIAIYFYSAVGKLDFEFLHTVGQQMLGVILKWTGIEPAKMAMPVRLGLVALFPIIELVLALGLIRKSLRRMTAVFAILFHVGLVLVLGPLGMNHRPSVLVWNIQIAMQVYWLFVASSETQTSSLESSNSVPLQYRDMAWSERASLLMVIVVLVMPLFERLGVWDHWPSWALYAPHSSRVQVEISTPAIAKLPTELAKLSNRYNNDEDVLTVWSVVPIDAWSLEALDTPIYPQSRFQLGVATVVLQKIAPEYEARIAILGTANRFSGKREIRWLENEEQISAAAEQFWINTNPRKWPQAYGAGVQPERITEDR